MSLSQPPDFLAREIVDIIHAEQIEAHGGTHGLRNEDGLESALAQPINMFCYGEPDLYDLAAAYAFHIAESQAFLDGNKRTGAQAALVFLDVNGIDTAPLPELEAFQAMIKIATHEMTRDDLATFFRAKLQDPRNP